MIARFRAKFPYATRVVNIAEYPLAGGCLGCFRCAVSEKCVYKDKFDEFLRENIQKADYVRVVGDAQIATVFVFDDVVCADDDENFGDIFEL